MKRITPDVFAAHAKNPELRYLYTHTFGTTCTPIIERFVEEVAKSVKYCDLTKLNLWTLLSYVGGFHFNQKSVRPETLDDTIVFFYAHYVQMDDGEAVGNSLSYTEFARNTIKVESQEIHFKHKSTEAIIRLTFLLKVD